MAKSLQFWLKRIKLYLHFYWKHSCLSSECRSLLLFFSFLKRRNESNCPKLDPQYHKVEYKNVPWQFDGSFRLLMFHDLLLLYVKWEERDWSCWPTSCLQVPVDSHLQCTAAVPSKDLKLCWRQWQDLLQLKYLKIQTSRQIFHFQEQKMQLSFSLNTKRFHFWLYLKKSSGLKDKISPFWRSGWISICRLLVWFLHNSSESGDLDSSNYWVQYSWRVHLS